MLVLAPDTLADLRARARDAAPAECCGLLIGGTVRDGSAGDGRRIRADDVFVTSIRPVPNDDPRRYHIPPADFIAAERAARVTGQWVCGVYHSHPAGAPLPSAADHNAAWPGFIYVIIGESAVRAWRLSDERRFTEVDIDVRLEAASVPAGSAPR